MNAGPDFLAAMIAFIGIAANAAKINSLHLLFGGWEKWVQGEAIWNIHNVSNLQVDYLISQEDNVFAGAQLADFVIINRNPGQVPHGNTKAAVVELKCKTVAETLAAFRARVLLDTTKLSGVIILPGQIPSHTIARCQMVLLPNADAAAIDGAIRLQLNNGGVPLGNINTTNTPIAPAAPGQLSQLFVWWTQ